MYSIRLKNIPPINITDPLRAYISQHFGEPESNNLDPALADIQQFRDRVQIASEKSNFDISRAICSHEEYLQALIGLQSRFPFGAHEHGSIFRSRPVSTVMVQWRSSDSFRPQKFTMDYNVKLEESTVVFNLAAIHSHQANQIERDSANGSQNAAKSFMAASGILQTMATSMAVHVPGYECVDLSSSSLNYLSICMLAQAAVCTYENAIAKAMSPAVLAVLASGIAELYHQASVILNADPQLLRWISKSDFAGNIYLGYQIGCFESAAQYWQSEKDLSDCAYGVVVARLQLAKSICDMIAQSEPKLENVVATRKKLLEAINLKLKAAVHDNDTIYHYSVPQKLELAPITPKIIVKPTPFTLPEGRLSKEFKSLIPVDVQNAVQNFKAQMSNELSALSQICSESSDICRSALAEMNLPAALDALNSEAGLPEETAIRIAAVQQKGGLSAILSSQARIQELASSSWSKINELEKLLREEQENEDKFRNLYRDRWDRTPSNDITKTHYRDIATAKKYLEQAKSSDDKVAVLLRESREIIAVVSKPIAEIEAMLPKLAVSGKSDDSEKVRVVLRELSALLRNRDKLVDNFLTSIADHDPSSEIMKKRANGISFEECFVAEKANFDSHRTEIDQNLARQSELFDAIVDANQEFISNRKRSGVQDERQQWLQRINDAIAAAEKLQKNLNEGLGFYTNLMKEYLCPLHDTVLGFVTARDHEARLVLEDISRSYGSTQFSNRPHPSYGQQSNPSSPMNTTHQPPQNSHQNNGSTPRYDPRDPSAPPLF